MNQPVLLSRQSILKTLAQIRRHSNLAVLQRETRALGEKVANSSRSEIAMTPGNGLEVENAYLLGELDQIRRAQTLERALYYVSRLQRALTSVKTAKVNDLNLRRWKGYDDVLTDSLWILPKRDSSGDHSAWYWGNFVPQIPHQLLLRYTKKGEWVLDPFAGSGTTLLECQRLGRNGFGVELNRRVADKTRSILQEASPSDSVKTAIVSADSTTLDFRSALRSYGTGSVQLAILHPPYHDIIRFSNNRRDLSNAASVEQFIHLFGQVVDNVVQVLDSKRYMVVVIGDKYTKREWIPLGFKLMEEVLRKGLLLKSIVIKNFDHTTGKRKQESLWRYRALVGGFYVFKHEYIFVFQKE